LKDKYIKLIINYLNPLQSSEHKADFVICNLRFLLFDYVIRPGQIPKGSDDSRILGL